MFLTFVCSRDYSASAWFVAGLRAGSVTKVTLINYIATFHTTEALPNALNSGVKCREGSLMPA